MSDALKLIRQELLTIKPFDTTRIGFETGVLLDANESPWDYCSDDGVRLNRYVDGMIDQDLITPLARFYQVDPSQVLLTRGSCEGIDLIVRAFCRSYQDAIMVCPPTFSVFAQCGFIQGAQVISVPLLKDQDFALDVPGILNKVTDNTKLIFICSPNNPTGNLIPMEEILTIIKAVQGKSMVVVDEAYIEFAHAQSATTLIEQYSNVVVLRTLSKAFGLAGLRGGMVIAQAPLLKILAGMMLPFPYSVQTIHAIKQAFSSENLEKVQQKISYLQQQREQVKAAMQALPIVKHVYDSAGNFLFVQFDDASVVLNACQEQEILVRHFVGSKEYENYLRFTIGLKAQNQRLINMLTSISATEPVLV